MKISPARVAAFDILSRIETSAAFSSVLLPIYEERLSDLDRRLCHELVMGVLRRQIYLDRVIDHFSDTNKLDSAVRTALRLGAYQLLFLDKIPSYSAINESVNLVRRAKKTSAKGLVNAVLRKVSQGPPELRYADEIDRVSVETSHPGWLIEKWEADLGHDTAVQIARANNSVPRHAFRLTRNGRSSTEDLTREAEQSQVVRGCFFAESIDERLRAAADAGAIYIQDEASQLVARAVGDVTGDRFFDVCAAPGGKTSQIATGIDHPEHSFIVAGDVHAARVSLLRSTCVKQGVGFVNVLQYNAETALPFADATFDTVLVDAPCSGTGTIRHNPEIRYFLTENDIAELTNKQLAILKNASKVVRSKGRLVYSTCSLQAEENEGVCGAFLAETPGFDRKRPDVPERFITSDGYARTFPHRDGMDGFFIAEFERG